MKPIPRSTSVRFERFRSDLLVYCSESGVLLGFYVPPQDRDYIMIARDPELIINRGEYSELDNIAHFDILPHQYDGWFAAGFALAEIVDWRELAHIHHPETAKSWQHEGFDAEATSLWLRRLQSDQAGLARTLSKLNLSPNDVGEWSARARVLPEQIPDWVEAEFDWRGAKPWRRLHFEPELAAWWRDEGFSAEEAARWIALGLTAEQRADWLNLGFNAAAATYWIDFGVTDPVEAKQWLASNLEEESVLLWREAGYCAEDALAFREQDIYEPPDSGTD